MKQFLYLIPLFLVACAASETEPSKKTMQNSVALPDTTLIEEGVTYEMARRQMLTDDEPVRFTDMQRQVILVGKNIEALDANFKKVATLQEGETVTTRRRSTKRRLPEDNWCESFYYVEVETKEGVYLVDGRNVYAPIDTFSLGDEVSQVTFEHEGNRWELSRTMFYGHEGVDEGTYGCYYSLGVILLKNLKSKQLHLIKIVENEAAKSIIDYDDFPYLRMIGNDAGEDNILSVEKIDGGVLLGMQRGFQEGARPFEIKVTVDGDSCWAEYNAELPWSDSADFSDYDSDY